MGSHFTTGITGTDDTARLDNQGLTLASHARDVFDALQGNKHLALANRYFATAKADLHFTLDNEK